MPKPKDAVIERMLDDIIELTKEDTDIPIPEESMYPPDHVVRRILNDILDMTSEKYFGLLDEQTEAAMFFLALMMSARCRGDIKNFRTNVQELHSAFERMADICEGMARPS